ncbi:ATP-binding cassette domain-containing protein, partial [Pseudomonas sp. R81]
MSANPVLLNVEHLKIRVGEHGPLAVDDLSFSIAPGEIVALVGESGSGKTMAARAAIGLLPLPMQVCGGRLDFQGRDLASVSTEALRAIRGASIGMVFQ